MIELAVPYRNVRAADLSWALDVPDEPALHRQVHTVGVLSVEVRILGASHQIVVWKDGLVVCRETVACREGVPGSLPAAEERELEGGYRYEVRCDVQRVGSADFPAWGGALRSLAANRPGVTLGLFPEIPDAVTAVAIETLPPSLGGVLWRTWHTYPGPSSLTYGEVVTTRTVLYRGTPL